MGRYKESPEYRELRCPCCGKPMQEMEIEEGYLGFDDELCYNFHYRYRCKECNIKYDEEEGWTTPKGYKATITSKQSNYLNVLYNGYRGYDYDYFGNHVEVRFDKYIPSVLSKEFATRLIQDKLDERQEWVLQNKKEEEFNALLEKYEVNTHHYYGDRDGVRGYGLPIKGGLIIFNVNLNTYNLDAKEIELKVNDLHVFKQLYNNEEAINRLLNLKLDLIKLKEAHDKL